VYMRNGKGKVNVNAVHMRPLDTRVLYADAELEEMSSEKNENFFLQGERGKPSIVVPTPI